MAWCSVWMVGVVSCTWGRISTRECKGAACSLFGGGWHVLFFLHGFAKWTHPCCDQKHTSVELKKKSFWNHLFHKICTCHLQFWISTADLSLLSSSDIQNAEPECAADLYPLRVKLVQHYAGETDRFWAAGVLWSSPIFSEQKSGSFSLWHLFSAGHGSTGCQWQHSSKAYLQDGLLTAR